MLKTFSIIIIIIITQQQEGWMSGCDVALHCSSNGADAWCSFINKTFPYDALLFYRVLHYGNAGKRTIELVGGICDIEFKSVLPFFLSLSLSPSFHSKDRFNISTT